MGREEQEMAFIEAVDDILFRARADETVFSFVLDMEKRIIAKPATVKELEKRIAPLKLVKTDQNREYTKTGLVFGFSKNQILVAVIPGLKDAEDFPRTKSAEDFTRVKLFLDFVRKLF